MGNFFFITSISNYSYTISFLHRKPDMYANGDLFQVLQLNIETEGQILIHNIEKFSRYLFLNLSYSK